MSCAILLLLCLLSAGCAASGPGAGARQSTQSSGHDGMVPAGDRAGRAAAAYRAGRYGETIAITDEMRRAGDAPQTARYLAGLAAFRLGQLHEAEQHFELAAEGPDTWITVRAEAMLGMIALETDRPRRAADLLGRAASRLESPDAEEAARQAARAARAAGDHEHAARWERLSGAQGAAPGVSGSAGSGGATVGRYVLQIGAFEDLSAARTEANMHQPAVTRAGLGAIRIDTVTDARGRRLYAPRIGRFATASEAERIRLREGWLGFIVRSTSD